MSTPDKARHFFVIGGYTYSNPGDEAILKTTLARLDRLFPGSRFTIWCDRRDFSIRLSGGISTELVCLRSPWFFSKKGIFKGLMLSLYRHGYPYSARIVHRFSTQSGATMRKMKEADAIVFTGGGYLNSIYNLLQMGHLYALAKESGRPVYLLGQTIGPFFRAKDHAIVEEMCEGAARVVIREEASRSELPRLGAKIVVGGDDALGFRGSLTDKGSSVLDRHFPDDGCLTIGLNLKLSKRPDDAYVKLVENLNRFNREAAGGKLRVVFVPMETSAFCDDRLEADKLSHSGKIEFDYHVLSEPLTVEERLAAVARCDLLIGMRYHALVFALSSAVPCLALFQGAYYERKIGGLLAAFGIEQHSLRMDRLSELYGALFLLLQNREQIRALIQDKLSDALRRQEDIYRSVFLNSPV